MKTTLLHFMLSLRYSFWFIPALMVIAVVIMAFSFIAIDHAAAPVLSKWEWLYTGGAEGARAILATIAGSTISVAGIVISMTMVTLSLTASQFGPRLLRNFMRDRITQSVLGAFIATFLYCVLVLRTIRGLEDVSFVPHLSLTVGVLLGLLSIGALVYFVHYVSTSIQVENIVTAVGGDLLEAMATLFPEKLAESTRSSPLAPRQEIQDNAMETAGSLLAQHNGYIQAIDNDGLLNIATQQELILELMRRPGDFVIVGTVLARVWPADKDSQQLTEQVNGVILFGSQRTSEQDVLFAVNQLVEVAIRALSPGINDPFTALRCIDWLGAALCRLAAREIPSAYRYDDHGQLRIIAPRVTFPDVVETAFSPIRHYGRADRSVTLHLLEMMCEVAGFIQRQEDREALLYQARIIIQGSHSGLLASQDRQDAERFYARVIQALTTPLST